MSRSMKRVPSCCVCPREPGVKRAFNRRIRRIGADADLPDGGSYRKMNESWDICDFKDAWTSYEAFKAVRARFSGDLDEAVLRDEYNRWYIRK